MSLYCLRLPNPLCEDYEPYFQLDPKLIVDVQPREALEDQLELLSPIKINLLVFNCSYHSSLRRCWSRI